MFALDAFLFNKYSHLRNYIQKYRTVINISKISKDDLENSIAVFQKEREEDKCYIKRILNL
ncbi:hypothetical protein CBOS2020_22330 [Clostridium botulinum]|nr:hypothetical protein CBOS2020_22330 [Clostridium botulinum]